MWGNQICIQFRHKFIIYCQVRYIRGSFRGKIPLWKITLISTVKFVLNQKENCQPYPTHQYDPYRPGGLCNSIEPLTRNRGINPFIVIHQHKESISTRSSPFGNTSHRNQYFPVRGALCVSNSLFQSLQRTFLRWHTSHFSGTKINKVPPTVALKSHS